MYSIDSYLNYQLYIYSAARSTSVRSILLYRAVVSKIRSFDFIYNLKLFMYFACNSNILFHDCLKYAQFIHEYACFIRESLKFMFYLEKKQSYIYFVKLNILYTYLVDAKLFHNSSGYKFFAL